MITPFLFAAFLWMQAAGGHNEHIERGDFDFQYSWPAQAEQIPTLRARLMAERNTAFAEGSADAREDARRRRREGLDPMGHSYAKGWEVVGDNAALLSMIGSESSFSGGAHGNSELSSLLWDRPGNRAVTVGDVIGGAALAGMTDRYCARLDALRSERRGGEPVVRDPEDQFTICPAIAEQVLAPADADSDGRFDTLCILFGPYDAGPYAEGEYIVEIPFGDGDLAALGPAHRSHFEAGTAGPGSACAGQDRHD